MTATLDPFAPLMLSIVTVSPVAVSDGDVSAVASGRGEVQLANAKASVAAKATSRAGRITQLMPGIGRTVDWGRRSERRSRQIAVKASRAASRGADP